MSTEDTVRHVNNVSEGDREKQSYANKRVTGKEQYYTNSDVVDLCVNRVLKTIKVKDKLILEPAGGTGQFIEGLLRAGVIASNIISYDIEPKHPMVLEKDFLDTDLNQSGIVCITNPPFGRANSLSKKFFNHAASNCDYICFLVPKSWRKWSVINSLDENFHLIDDTELPKNCFHFAGKEEPKKKDVLNTVFQIWERRDYIREKIKIPDHDLIKKVNPVIKEGVGKVVRNANFEIIAFGYSCGKCQDISDVEVPYKTTTMYLNIERDDVKDALREIDLSEFYKNVAYIEALSIKEINYKLNEYFKLDNFEF